MLRGESAQALPSSIPAKTLNVQLLARDHGSCTQSIIEYVQPARPSMAGFA